MDVTINGLSKRYKAKCVFSNLCLSFERGHLHALLGENGTGKSTLFGILSGSQIADSGYISLDNRMASFCCVSDAQKCGIFCVAQHPVLVPWITVKDNIMLGVKKVRRDASKKALEKELYALKQKWCPLLEMDNAAHSILPSHKMFAALLFALLGKPRLLLLDESTALLSGAECQQFYANLKAYIAENAMRKINVIVITHRGREAENYCDDAVYMNKKHEIAQRVTPAASAPPVEHVRGRLILIKGSDSALSAMEKDVLCNAAIWREKGAAIIPTDRTHTASSPSLTVAQMLCALRRGGVDNDFAAMLISQAGIDASPLSLCSSLSGGMLQRLIMQREMQSKPKYIFAFNPLQGLDNERQKEIVQILRNAANEGSIVKTASSSFFPEEAADEVVRI